MKNTENRTIRGKFFRVTYCFFHTLVIVSLSMVFNGCIKEIPITSVKPVVLPTPFSQTTSNSFSDWEYQAIGGSGVLPDSDLKGIEALLNPLGQEGWDISGAAGPTFILQRSSRNDIKWEYKAIQGAPLLDKSNSTNLVNRLQPLGQKGWQVATVTRNEIILLKRPLSSVTVWEYQVLNNDGLIFDSDPVDVIERLNALGEEGWELGGVKGWVLLMQRPTTHLDRWEYQVINPINFAQSAPGSDLINSLNSLGKVGWDIAGISVTTLILKRSFLAPKVLEYQQVFEAGPIVLGKAVDFLAFLSPLGQAGWVIAGMDAPTIIMKRILASK